MSCHHLCAGAIALLLFALTGCGDSAPAPRPRRDAAPDLTIASDSAGGGTGDARAPDSALTDTAVADGPRADSSASDGPVADSAVADSQVALPDSAAADGPVADQAVADSAVPDAAIIADAAVDLTVDAPAADASPDQAVSPPDTGPDAPSFCTAKVTCGCQAYSKRLGRYVHLSGKVKKITGAGFPDFLVKIVDSVGEDLKRQIVPKPGFPDSCGKWQHDDFPDFTYKEVTVGVSDFQVRDVTDFPGLPPCIGTCP